jgi:outer membrane protein assembly factor BamE
VRRAIFVFLIKYVLPILILLAGCSRVPILPGLTPYRMDIQQGNYVTQDMVTKLKPGMSKAQVRFALGTPLVVDPFHADRWDYIYLLQKRGRTVEHRRLIVLFQDDKLLRLEGDVRPLENNAGTPGSPAAAVTSAP